MTDSRAPRMNTAPAGFRAERALPAGFAAFFARLHAELSPRQQRLAAARRDRLAAAHTRGVLPDHLPPSQATTGPWRIELPAWCADQRNQMTGPADDAALVVKMLNSGAPGVMLDLEDSMANDWSHLMTGIANIRAALEGTLTYDDARRGRAVGIEPSGVAIWNRVRGLHLSQAGVTADGSVASASLFDLALVAWNAAPEKLRHPLAIYIPKSESAEEAGWWRDAFQMVAEARGWPRTTLRCMALVESHPLAYQMEEFLHELREHIVGLNLGRWDYMASLIHWNFENPAWVLPDRNTIPHDVPFFQRLRHLLVDVCHRRGALAIGGMTALYPSRVDAELNARAGGARAGQAERGRVPDGRRMDGPPRPERHRGRAVPGTEPDRTPAAGRGALPGPEARPRGRRAPLAGRHAGRCPHGDSLSQRRPERQRREPAGRLHGDLATDRIYRLMLAQRLRHRDVVRIPGPDGAPVVHDEALLARCLDEALGKLVADLPLARDVGTAETLGEARRRSEAMILNGWFDPA